MSPGCRVVRWFLRAVTALFGPADPHPTRTAKPDHRLTYGVQTSQAGTSGLFAMCACGEFCAWLEGSDAETELALLNVHAAHMEMIR